MNKYTQNLQNSQNLQEQINRMKTLNLSLKQAAKAYYQDNTEIISNLEYDKLYAELEELERATGLQMSDSPTVSVGYFPAKNLAKIQHEVPLLSLDKTKEVDKIADFLAENTGLISWKLDGLTIALIYENGELVSGITRGNGLVGEDVTHNVRTFQNIPLRIPYTERLLVRGEAVITYDDFEKINATIEKPEDKYKNPRNLCSGTVRQLDNTGDNRNVHFYAFSMVDFADLADLKSSENTEKSQQLEFLSTLGFDVAEYQLTTAATIAQDIAKLKQNLPKLGVPSDGLVITYNNIAYSLSLGATSKFPKDSLAFKWEDEQLETTLLRIDWNTSRTGLINPVAIFEPVELEGTTVNKASLHNISIVRRLALGEGDTITVYKANMIIPQVAENLTKSNTVEIPQYCPVCGSPTEIIQKIVKPKKRKSKNVEQTEQVEQIAQIEQLDIEQIGQIAQNEQTQQTTETSEIIDQTEIESEFLLCLNPNCSAQLLGSMVHFCGRDAMNIEGLSEQTLEKWLNNGFINDYTDIFNLQRYKEKIVQMDGFGQKSFENLAKSIERAKNVNLPNFIFALGIKHVGLSNAKLLCNHFGNLSAIISAIKSSDKNNTNNMEELLQIKGFGDAIANSLCVYFSNENNVNLVENLAKILQIAQSEQSANSQKMGKLHGLVFVITGNTEIFANRKALQAEIETHGGKCTASVSAKTSYLINNNAASTSSKNQKAHQLGVKIITEKDFVEMFQ
ncbi:MAG: NAD-dependent DNA ligase LigA [Defluviitaleaceae bacterium]|nr:NAD-dependent DNA ligase LigA [Defluviitaleaceae bacterium]